MSGQFQWLNHAETSLSKFNEIHTFSEGRTLNKCFLGPNHACIYNLKIKIFQEKLLDPTDIIKQV